MRTSGWHPVLKTLLLHYIRIKSLPNSSTQLTKDSTLPTLSFSIRIVFCFHMLFYNCYVKCQIWTHPNQCDVCLIMNMSVTELPNFIKKISFITRVINIQILMTKYFSFQYSVTYCSQALRRPAHTAHETVLCLPVWLLLVASVK